jgi:hypothetical protein
MLPPQYGSHAGGKHVDSIGYKGVEKTLIPHGGVQTVVRAAAGRVDVEGEAVAILLLLSRPLR